MKETGTWCVGWLRCSAIKQAANEFSFFHLLLLLLLLLFFFFFFFFLLLLIFSFAEPVLCHGVRM